MIGEPRGFLELRQDSRVMMVNSGSLSCGPSEAQSPFEFRGGAWHCYRVTAGELGLKSRGRGNLEVFLELWQESLCFLDL